MFSAIAAFAMFTPGVPEPAHTTTATPAKVQVGSPVGYEKFTAGGKTYHLVKADIASGMVEADTYYSGSLQLPWSIVGDTQPIAAITGTFFAPQNGVPVADVVHNGELMAKGNRGTVVAIAADGAVSFENRAFKRGFDWTGFRAGVRGAVRLIENGVVKPNPKAQSFKDPRIWGRASRTGIGLDHRGKLVFVATSANVTLSEFGRAMQKKGVIDAVSLDGGSSSFLYYNGNMLLRPARKLSNVLILKPTALAVQQGIQF